MYALDEDCELSYIRIIKNSSDVSISTKHVVECLRELGTSILDTTTYKDILKTIFVSSIRSKIRKTKEQIKLTDVPQRGITEVAKAPPEILEVCKKFTSINHVHADKQEYKKAKSKEIQEKLKQPTDTVNGFLEKSASLLQRVTVENKQYNITKKQTIRKPKITISMLETFLHSILEVHPPILTRQTLPQLELALCSKIQQVPPISSSKTILASLPNHHPHVV